jgi:hypothetical protein
MSRFKDFLANYKKPVAKKLSELNSEELGHYSNFLLKWNAASFIKFQRTKSWYITTTLLMIGLIIVAILLSSPTFAISILVFSMVYVYLTQEDPEAVEVIISDIGIVFGRKVYPFTEIKTFWIEYQPPAYQSLHLVLKKEFTEEITINFHGVNPTDIRTVLAQFLPEWEEREKNLTENLTRILGL